MNELIHIGSRTQIMASEIVMLEAEINYTRLFLNNGKNIVVSYHLGKLAERLANHESFVRPNRNTIVNLSFLTHYCISSLTIKQKAVAISRRRQTEAIIAKCKDYLQDN